MKSAKENSLRQKGDKRSLRKNERLKEMSEKVEDSNLSSDEDDEEFEKIMKSIADRYSQIGGDNLGKTKEFLKNFYQSSSVCLICLSSLRRNDAVWNCMECYGCFHINCIQKWSRDSLFQLKQAMEELPAFKRKKICWGCPKCRKDYEECDIPRIYKCFCLKAEDPAHNPWIAAHSCGDVCAKPLEPDCGHTCLLLCHPGPCPPCPKTVKTDCYCGKIKAEMKRCFEKSWTCQQTCGKSLVCNKHECPSKCHPDLCPPCPKKSQQSCDCGLKSTQRPCSEPNWKCEKVCGKQFSCGFHKCKIVCHSNECGKCPLSLNRFCPCGKTDSILPCSQEVPTCNDTCGKMMACGIHICQLKCHKDKCACLEVVQKSCRCGLHRKEVPCGKEYTCETKCKRSRSCQKHPCNRKCCDGECPPCDKLCGKKLGCGSHKCQSACHLGGCYPCTQTRIIKCHCGTTTKSVPCGSKGKRAPLCAQPCSIPPDCFHSSREIHSCHFGECPPCKQVCEIVYPKCKHVCLSKCHTSVWCKIKYETLKWDVYQPEYVKKALPCPPCEAPVTVRCWGDHETLQLLCSQPPNYSCLKLCKKMLNCKNHTCSVECHKDKCLPCELPCQVTRPTGCSHPCDLPCHSGPCNITCIDIKVKCHCGISTLYIPCATLVETQKGENLEALSCGTPCQLNYPCGHKCRSKCHAGVCPDPELCRKKVKVSCKCLKLKKEFTCDVICRGGGIVSCDASCEAEKMQKLKAIEIEKAKRKEEADRKNKEELEEFEKKLYGKKKVRDRRRDIEIEAEPSFIDKYWLYIFAVSAIIISAIIYFMLN